MTAAVRLAVLVAAVGFAGCSDDESQPAPTPAESDPGPCRGEVSGPFGMREGTWEYNAFFRCFERVD